MKHSDREEIAAFAKKMREEGAAGFASGLIPWETWDDFEHRVGSRIAQDSDRPAAPPLQAPEKSGHRVLTAVSAVAVAALVLGITGVYLGRDATEPLAINTTQPLPADNKQTSGQEQNVAVNETATSASEAATILRSSTDPEATALQANVKAKETRVALKTTGGEPDAPGKAASQPPADVIQKQDDTMVEVKRIAQAAAVTPHIPAAASDMAAAAAKTAQAAHRTEQKLAADPLAVPPALRAEAKATGAMQPPSSTTPGMASNAMETPAEKPASVKVAEAKPAAAETVTMKLAEAKPAAANVAVAKPVVVIPAAAKPAEAKPAVVKPAATKAAAAASPQAGDKPGAAAQSAVRPVLPRVSAQDLAALNTLPAPAAGQVSTTAPAAQKPATAGTPFDRKAAQTNLLSKREVTPPAPQTPQQAAAKKHGDWSVNLGSFTKQSVADEMKDRFLKKGVAADKLTATVNGRKFYRLRVTGFETRQAAQRESVAIREKLGLAEAWVTKK